jgi:hypothetical protein
VSLGDIISRGLAKDRSGSLRTTTFAKPSRNWESATRRDAMKKLVQKLLKHASDPERIAARLETADVILNGGKCGQLAERLGVSKQRASAAIIELRQLIEDVEKLTFVEPAKQTWEIDSE